MEYPFAIIMKTQAEYHRDWYKKNKERLREYKRTNMQRYRESSPEKHAHQSREAKRRLRQKLLALYGPVCVCCGFTDARALTLDHVKNNGAAERAELGERGVYRRALTHKADYQILCMNCQFIKRFEVAKTAVVKLAWETLMLC